MITDHEFLVRMNKVLDNHNVDSFTVQLDIQNQLNNDHNLAHKPLEIVFYPNGSETLYKKEHTNHHDYIVSEQKFN